MTCSPTCSPFLSVFFLSVCLCVILWFELRTLWFLGRCSTAWVVPPALFPLAVFHVGSQTVMLTYTYASRICSNGVLLTVSPRVAWNSDSPDRCLLSSWEYRYVLPCPASFSQFLQESISAGVVIGKMGHKAEDSSLPNLIIGCWCS
jgi:hypothetical protein